MSMQSPEITIIVPCYNYGRYLPDCLESIFSQQGSWSIEVIVIDDASSDDTAEAMRRYEGRIRPIRHTVNRGHAATLTEGLQAASGAYVARIDPDDRLRPCFLAATVPILRRHPEVGLVYGDVALIDEHGRETLASCDEVHGGHDFKGNEFVKLLARNYICAPTVLARREAWLDALPIPDKLPFNDWHFTTMIARRHEFYYVHRVLADYRVHAANLHVAISRNRTEEPAVFRLLDRYYAETEADPALEREKRKARNRIYATRYLEFGDKYFGQEHAAEARRCYLRAIRHSPATALRLDILRRLAGTLIGLRAYRAIKQALRFS